MRTCRCILGVVGHLKPKLASPRPGWMGKMYTHAVVAHRDGGFSATSNAGPKKGPAMAGEMATQTLTARSVPRGPWAQREPGMPHGHASKFKRCLMQMFVEDSINWVAGAACTKWHLGEVFWHGSQVSSSSCFKASCCMGVSWTRSGSRWFSHRTARRCSNVLTRGLHTPRAWTASGVGLLNHR